MNAKVTTGAIIGLLLVAHSARGQLPIADRLVVRMDEQVLRGTLYVGSLRSPDGNLLSPMEAEALYFIVEDPEQVFVYDKRQVAQFQQDHVALFGSTNMRSQATAVRLDEYRWEISGPRLLFGRVSRPKGGKMPVPTVGRWDFNEQGIVLPQEIVKGTAEKDSARGKGGFGRIVARYSDRIDKNPKDGEALRKRAEAYRVLREFPKALADCEKAGSELQVEVAAQKADLMVESDKVGSLSRGEKLRVLKTHRDWLWVETGGTTDAKRGWIQCDAVR